MEPEFLDIIQSFPRKYWGVLYEKLEKSLERNPEGITEQGIRHFCCWVIIDEQRSDRKRGIARVNFKTKLRFVESSSLTDRDDLCIPSRSVNDTDFETDLNLILEHIFKVIREKKLLRRMKEDEIRKLFGKHLSRKEILNSLSTYYGRSTRSKKLGQLVDEALKIIF